MKLCGPIIGQTEVPGVLLAAGHDSWGTQNAPVTGKVMSEVQGRHELQT